MVLSMASVSQWVSKLFGCNGIMHNYKLEGLETHGRLQLNCML